MSARKDIKDIAIRIWGNDVKVEVFMSEMDPIIAKLIGEDDTDTTEMPRTWSETLRKQYVNFRNHLRRQMRVKWGKKE